MNQSRVTRCAVCREPQASPEGWFQLLENRWTDRLKIFRFQESLASHLNFHSVCCPAHVRELVVHWMTIGRLDVPFAHVPSGPRRFFFQRSQKQDREVHEPACLPLVLLGELSVHRESLTRILHENPEALSAVLESLIQALEVDPGKRPAVATATAARVTLGEPVAI
jgi:hypothetical protein